MARIVGPAFAEVRNNVTNAGEPEAHDFRITRRIDEFVDRAAIETSSTLDLDMNVVNVTPLQVRRRNPRVLLALAHR